MIALVDAVEWYHVDTSNDKPKSSGATAFAAQAGGGANKINRGMLRRTLNVRNVDGNIGRNVSLQGTESARPTFQKWLTF
ncbi:hypothetical protein N7495_003833 [Penicillium taxi]|uniref:uncharacterized protein n=1 Tax=Penicillium taxi TaxID=168475 RepID=UPI0025455F70|nr:uncharacterized protein N7495_003833 [Penicillium taxi]KAJ5899089.1 hypothetical protein N7495_003833 [Penicillium taxi]